MRTRRNFWLQISPSLSIACLLLNANNLALADAETVRRISPPENGFYAKEIDFQGLPIKAPEVVADTALQEAHRRMQMMLGNVPAIRATLVSAGSELHIIGKDQQTSDLPENRSMKGKETDPGVDFDKRTRGVGGKFASCGEENLLHLPNDRYADRDICVHEFAHTVMEYGLDSNARSKITDQYNRSTARGLWKTMYAGTNDKEFFAEISMWYFGTRGDYGSLNPKPSPGPAWLKSYDPDAYQLVNQIYHGPVTPEKWPASAAPLRPAFKSDTSRLVTLQPLTAGAESGLKSADAGVPTNLILINTTDRPMQVFWLNYLGARQSYGYLPPRQRKELNTFSTHPWVVVERNGRVAAIFVATAKPCVGYVR